jgi:hypothetical protein
MILHPPRCSALPAKKLSGGQAGALMLHHRPLNSSADRLPLRQEKTEMSWRYRGTNILGSPDLFMLHHLTAVDDLKLDDELHLYFTRGHIQSPTMPSGGAIVSSRPQLRSSLCGTVLDD